jgi:hypothetical protein
VKDVIYNHANTATAPTSTAPTALRPAFKLSAAPVVEGVALASAGCVPCAPAEPLADDPVAVGVALPDVGVPLKSCFWPMVGRGDVGLTSQKLAV